MQLTFYLSGIHVRDFKTIYLKICLDYARQMLNCYLTDLSISFACTVFCRQKQFYFTQDLSQLKASQLQWYLHWAFATNSGRGKKKKRHSSTESGFLLTLDYQINFFNTLFSWYSDSPELWVRQCLQSTGTNLGKNEGHS